MSWIDVINIVLGFGLGLITGIVVGVVCAKGESAFYDDVEEEYEEGRK